MSGKNREVAVFNDNEANLEVSKRLVNALYQTKAFDKIQLFTRAQHATVDEDEDGSISIKIIPEHCDTLSKARNFINQTYREREFTGYLHVVEDWVMLLKDPSSFLDSIEKMMDILDYDVWLDTICDPCNYVYSKFNPRVSVDIDRDDVKKLDISKKIMFTSHSNTAWMCYNYKKIPDDLLRFNESFNIPMFMIIEFLARRRNTKRKDQVYFMNMYATVQEEIGVFKIDDQAIKAEQKTEKMAEEDKIFKDLNLNYQPDNDIDKLLEILWDKIKSKI